MAKAKRKGRAGDPQASPQPSRRPTSPLCLAKLQPRRELAVCAGLALLIVLVYWPVAGHQFINYDDDGYVTDNSHVNSGLTWTGTAWSMTAVCQANWHPLTWLSHMLDCRLFGLNPGGHHVVSLGLHVVNSMLLYLVLVRMTGAAWRSAIVAALFAVHPLHVESVAWVAERKDVLSTVFGLAAIWTWLSYLSRPSTLRYTVVMLCFTASLMSKPMLVTLPFVLLLLDYWPLGRAKSQQAQRSQLSSVIPHPSSLILEKLPLLALSAVSCIVTLFAQSRGGAVMSLAKQSIAARVATMLQAYCGYLQKMLWPRDLAPIYPLPDRVNYAAAAICAVVLVGLSVALLWPRPRQKYVAVGWLWYLGMLVPVIGIVQVGLQAMADRYTYLPLVGIFIAVTWAAADFAAARSWAVKPVAGLGVVAVAVCAWLTAFQVPRWADSETLFRHTLAVTGDNAVAHNNLGNAVVGHPNYEEAETHYREALRIDPAYIDAYGSMAELRAKQGRLDEAALHYQKILDRDPRCVKAYRQLSHVLVRQGDRPAAEVYLAKVVEMVPDDIDARMGLAEQQQVLGKTQAAVASFEAVLRLSPRHSGAANNLAWLLATHPDARFRNGLRAVSLLEPFAAGPRSEANLLDSLAAAYSEAGRFDDAVRTAKLAEARAQEEGQSAESLAGMNRRAELYKQGKPYRDPLLAGPAAKPPE